MKERLTTGCEANEPCLQNTPPRFAHTRLLVDSMRKHFAQEFGQDSLSLDFTDMELRVLVHLEQEK